MSTIAPPVYTSRDHSQVQAGPPSSTPSTPSSLEFAETTTVSLEWRLSGLRAMYESSKGDTKSKCIKSAVFGDADNLWEVLWYPNSGVQGGDYASLYLSCVPTSQERDQGIGNKWVRKGLWWFRFEVKIPEERTGKLVVLASKDASDHTFAVKTANWGWQQFAKRDQLFLHQSVVQSDSFIIVCTISAQPQPPAGYWLGLGTAPAAAVAFPALPGPGARLGSGSGGGLSAWAGGDGASGGVAGGTMAAGGVKRIVPKELISAVGEMLDDPLYSDIEFVIPTPRLRDGTTETDGAQQQQQQRRTPRRIYANKKLLNRCEYFEAMFHGGFGEVEGMQVEDDLDDELDLLSDSDEEDEAEDILDASSLHLTSPVMTTTTTARDASPSLRSTFVLGDAPGPGPTPADPQFHRVDIGGDSGATGTGDESNNDTGDEPGPIVGTVLGVGVTSGHEDGTEHALPQGMDATDAAAVTSEVQMKPLMRSRAHSDEHAAVVGPKKTRIVVRDAAWSTWWAVLYWLYTDVIYFAPLSSSFLSTPFTPIQQGHTRTESGVPLIAPPRTRREWIGQWLAERGSALSGGPVGIGIGVVTLSGPRPVSAKAVYRLADKLDLPALKLRAFQHICSQLTASNIPAEVFSRFSSTFEDVRKVQVAFFLRHWSEIKKSDTMQNIWKQIRDGKHVGFEEVWPLIVGQLDFRPS